MGKTGLLLALAAAAPPPALPPAASPAAEEAIVQEIRVFADATVMAKTNGPADKVVFLGRNDKGEPEVVGIMVVAPGAPVDQVAPGTLAILRTRSSSPRGNKAIDPADAALAAKTGLPVFEVGIWKPRPVIREIMPAPGGAQVREIDPRGVPGAWRPLTP